jgi:glycosyltransferase involved in cell wall biosynthesis
VKIAAGVLTRNAITHGRQGLTRNALNSLSEADTTVLVDNGSDDGSDQWAETLGAYLYKPEDNNTTCGRGMNTIAALLVEQADVIVLTSDDMVWRAGWRNIVEQFWTAAESDVAILCGLLEPAYPWSSVIGTYQAGDITALSRTCVPGSGWTLRSSDWPTIGPVPEQPGEDDVPTCKRLNDEGRLLVAVDIADHVGEQRSTWGNQSHRFARALGTEADAVTRLK